MRYAPLLTCVLLVGCWDKSRSDTAIPDDTWKFPDDTWQFPDDTYLQGDDSGQGGDDSGHSGDDSGHSGDDSGHSGDDSGHSGDDSGHSGDDSGGDDSGLPADADGDGWTTDDGDCDDGDAAVNPGAHERCDTDYDDDCDGLTNSEDALGCVIFYGDGDTDGYGGLDAACLCEADGIYTATDTTDCEDADSSIHPGADEYCDGVDEDCDGQIDEDAVDMNSWYADSDGDGYGDPNVLVWSCGGQPSGTSTDNTDCADNDASAFPGSHATETPFDGVDQDCDGDDFCTDLDCDGLADVVYASFRNSSNYTTNSLLYYGASSLSNSSRTTLRTYGAIRTLVADLNGDGYQDVVFSNHYSGSTFETDSSIYWGGASGYSASNRTNLPTMGAYGVASADFNGDGYVDLAFANHHDDSSYVVDSYVYWGSASGFSSTDRTDLPTLGAWELSTADLDRDGYPDLVFSNTGDDSSYEVDSVIYWGSAVGFRSSDRTDLPTEGSWSHAIGDFDGDGWDDIAFGNYINDSLDYTIDSVVYWGSSAGFSANSYTNLATSGAYFVRAADLEGDGDDDLVVSNYYNGSNFNGPSAVFRGGSRSMGGGETFNTVGAFEPALTDLDADGYLDIVMPQVGTLGTYTTDSAVLWGSSGAYSDSNRIDLATTAGQGAAVADYDGDGWLDIAFGEYYNGSYSNSSAVYWGGSSGYGASTSSLSTTGAYAPPVAVGR